jgi:hypothetical protein
MEILQTVGHKWTNRKAKFWDSQRISGYYFGASNARI